MVLPRNTQTDLDRSSGIALTACGGETFNQVYESSTCPTLTLQPNLEQVSEGQLYSRTEAHAGGLTADPPSLGTRFINGGYARLTNVSVGPGVALLVLELELCLALVPLITS